MQHPWALTWDTVEFAEQITLLDHHYFSQCRSDAYMQLLRTGIPKLGAGNEFGLRCILEYTSWFRTVSVTQYFYISKTIKLQEYLNTFFLIILFLKLNIKSESPCIL